MEKKIFKSGGFGISPGEDVTEKLFGLISSAGAKSGKKIIKFEKGVYFLNSEKCRKYTLFITNTIGEGEYRQGEERKSKTISL